MSTVWWRYRHNKHLIKIVAKYNNGNNKVFFDERGNCYYTHQSINAKLPFWISKLECKKHVSSGNTYFKPNVYEES